MNYTLFKFFMSTFPSSLRVRQKSSRDRLDDHDRHVGYCYNFVLLRLVVEVVIVTVVAVVVVTLVLVVMLVTYLIHGLCEKTTRSRTNTVHCQF